MYSYKGTFVSISGVDKMNKKKKLSLAAILLLLAVAFVGIGVVVTKTTPESSYEQTAQNDSGQQGTDGKNGDKKAAEKLIGHTYSRDEIEEKVGEWNNFELDGAGCERGVYAGKFFYDNIIVLSRTYDKGKTFRVISVRNQ